MKISNYSSLIRLTLGLGLSITMFAACGVAEGNDSLFGHLPKTVQDEILGARHDCEESLSVPPPEIDSGIQQIDLNGDGSKDIIVDWAEVACVMPRAGCSRDGGCNLDVYKQLNKATWKQVFSEQVEQHYISQSSKGKMRLMAVTIVGGNSQCKELSSDGSRHTWCDAFVFWNNGKWLWRPIR